MMICNTLLGIPQSEDAVQTQRRWARRVIQEYSSPGRRFHNLMHLDEAHAAASMIIRGTCPYTEEEFHHVCMTTLYALTFHDYFYDPLVIMKSPGECEARSAEVAVQAAQELSPDLPDLPEAVAAAILGTATHTSEGLKGWVRYAARVVSDADLSILSSVEWRYDMYAEDIANEFLPFVSEDTLVMGRIKFLCDMMERGRIYQSHGLTPEFEETAKSNLAREFEFYTNE